MKWLVDLNASINNGWLISIASFDWSNNFGAIDVKMNGSVLKKKKSNLLIKMLELLLSSKLN